MLVLCERQRPLKGGGAQFRAVRPRPTAAAVLTA
jgi:hypothetical protein